LANFEQCVQIDIVCVDEFWRIVVVDGGKAVDDDGGPVESSNAQTGV
jgi:hypothetical protein